MADDLVETLSEKFFSNGADATLSGLPFHELLVEHLSETGDVDPACGLVTHVLDPVFAYISTTKQRKNQTLCLLDCL